MNLENVEDVYGLSPLQEGMMYHTLSASASGVFVQQVCCTIEGDLNVAGFKQAWAQVLDGHAVLRSVFLWEGLDEPLQVVREQAAIPWRQVNLDSLDEEGESSALSTFLADDRAQGFDLSDVPLMRMTLLDLGGDKQRFVWSFHHLIADGWSAALLLKEVFTRYSEAKRGGCFDVPKSLPFKDYIAYLHGQELGEVEAYWRDALGGFSSASRIVDPGVRLEPSAASHARQHRVLPAELAERLTEFARANRVTVNSVVLGAWAALLSCYSRMDDVVFGATVSGRPASLPGVESAVGMFINTLPVRVKVSDENVVDWLQSIQRNQVEARQYEHSPLVSIQKWSDMPSNESLFDSLVVFENYPEMTDRGIPSCVKDAGIAVGDFDYLEQSNYPLALIVIPGCKFEFYLMHEAAQYSEAFVEQILFHMVNILSAFVAKPNLRLSELSVLDEDESRRMLQEWNATTVDYGDEQTLSDRLSELAARQPDAPAVVFEDQVLSYGELEAQASLLAGRLDGTGVSVGDHVGLFADRSLEAIIGV